MGFKSLIKRGWNFIKSKIGRGSGVGNYVKRGISNVKEELKKTGSDIVGDIKESVKEQVEKTKEEASKVGNVISESGKMLTEEARKRIEAGGERARQELEKSKQKLGEAGRGVIKDLDSARGNISAAIQDRLARERAQLLNKIVEQSDITSQKLGGIFTKVNEGINLSALETKKLIEKLQKAGVDLSQAQLATLRGKATGPKTRIPIIPGNKKMLNLVIRPNQLN